MTILEILITLICSMLSLSLSVASILYTYQVKRYREYIYQILYAAMYEVKERKISNENIKSCKVSNAL